MKNLTQQSGFSLVTAIFLLVIIAAMGAFAVSVTTSQHQSDALDVMGKRAYQAARAGIEWGAFQIIQSGVNATFVTACQTGSTSQSISLPDAPLSSFTVNVACTSNGAAYNENGGNVWSYSLSASAAQGTAGNDGYVERAISVNVTTAQ